MTFQLLVERILPAQARQATYVEGSIMMHKLTPATLAHGGECHVYCSMHNQGAEQLVNDALHACGQAGHGIKVCTDPVQIAMCAKFVLYLDGRTWNGDELSAKKLAEEVEQAVEAGVKLCLAHEVPMFAFPGSGWDHIKAMDGSKKPTVPRTRHACDFGLFFVQTPTRLLQRNIYQSIATPLKAGPWRAVSLTMFAKQLHGDQNMRDPSADHQEAAVWNEQLAWLKRQSHNRSRRRLTFSSTTLYPSTPHLLRAVDAVKRFGLVLKERGDADAGSAEQPPSPSSDALRPSPSSCGRLPDPRWQVARDRSRAKDAIRRFAPVLNVSGNADASSADSAPSSTALRLTMDNEPWVEADDKRLAAAVLRLCSEAKGELEETMKRSWPYIKSKIEKLQAKGTLPAGQVPPWAHRFDPSTPFERPTHVPPLYQEPNASAPKHQFLKKTEEAPKRPGYMSATLCKRKSSGPKPPKQPPPPATDATPVATAIATAATAKPDSIRCATSAAKFASHCRYAPTFLQVAPSPAAVGLSPPAGPPPSLPKGIISVSKAIAFSRDARLRLQQRKLAATRMQAMQRGRSARGMYGVRCRAQDKTVFMDRKAEAVSIDAIVEREERMGIDARKGYCCGKAGGSEASNRYRSMQTRAEQAAIRMQAIQRGRSARKSYGVQRSTAPTLMAGMSLGSKLGGSSDESDGQPTADFANATAGASPGTTALAAKCKAPSIPQRAPPRRSGPPVSPSCQTSDELSPSFAQHSDSLPAPRPKETPGEKRARERSERQKDARKGNGDFMDQYKQLTRGAPPMKKGDKSASPCQADVPADAASSAKSATCTQLVPTRPAPKSRRAQGPSVLPSRLQEASADAYNNPADHTIGEEAGEGAGMMPFMSPHRACCMGKGAGSFSSEVNSPTKASTSRIEASSTGEASALRAEASLDDAEASSSWLGPPRRPLPQLVISSVASATTAVAKLRKHRQQASSQEASPSVGARRPQSTATDATSEGSDGRHQSQTQRISFAAQPATAQPPRPFLQERSLSGTLGGSCKRLSADVSEALGKNVSRDTRKAVKLMVRDGIANSTARSLHRYSNNHSTQWDLCGSSAVVERPASNVEQVRRQHMLTEMLGRADGSTDHGRKTHEEAPLKDGWQGGGGVRLMPPMIGDAQMVERMEVINIAALRWKTKFNERRHKRP